MLAYSWREEPGMIHPHTELRFINEKIGYGVVATQMIPRGTITWVRDEFDQAFAATHIERMLPLYQDLAAKYCFVDARGDYILCWDLARYLNHSCEPSCRSAGYDFELAVRDIAPGEELTDDYGSLNLEYDFVCFCQTPLCREKIRPDDLARYADSWDRHRRRALPTHPHGLSTAVAPGEREGRGGSGAGKSPPNRVVQTKLLSWGDAQKSLRWPMPHADPVVSALAGAVCVSRVQCTVESP